MTDRATPSEPGPDDVTGSEASPDQVSIDRSAVVPVYQALMTRYNFLAAARWQSLALGLAAQGFVIGAASQVQPAQSATSLVLGAVVLFIGLATIIVGQRFELVALADRHMLDAFEERLLGADYAELGLRHAMSSGLRGAEMLRGQYLHEYKSELGKGGPYWLINRLARLGPNHWWAYSQIVISVAGAMIPILRYLGV